MSERSGGALEYSSYRFLLFAFDTDAQETINVYDTKSGRSLQEFDGVYINSYLNAYELAASVATCCDYFKIPFVNSEMRGAPSLSKLSAYAKLAANGVSLPRTYAGTKMALVAGADRIATDLFPAILKRADADRGIDNFKVRSLDEALELLGGYDNKSLWILQHFIENDGFYLVSYYGQEPKFSIFRSLEQRPDQNELKAHMYKPKGGANARLVPLGDVPPPVMQESAAAIKTLKREIGSVDSIYDSKADKAYVLEVNYNPQLVTIETFKEERIQAFLDNIGTDW
jgi:glutathione synthase/RimK-type ligase-like ATP-grasp enzyme